MLMAVQIESIEAWEQLPESVRAEVGSPFCFLCENPKRLLVSYVALMGQWNCPNCNVSTAYSLSNQSTLS